jgi:hypothetical protein
MSDPEKPFGHLARIHVITWPAGSVAPEHVFREIHARGPASRVRSAARRVRGFSDILVIEPLTREQWLRAYGHGAETGRHWIR